jgi:hypothetical protein
VIIPSARRLTGCAAGVALAAIVAGALTAVHYHRAGLTLSHYDARGHLVVARRIIDSITPGWQQIGAVWLPLPHLLNALPVQVDAFYRTGASGVAVSVMSFAAACGAIAWIVMAVTGSPFAAVAAAAVFALNPNVLYLQSTPMTEPLLIALLTISVATMIRSLPAPPASPALPAPRAHPALPALFFALACLTRYEAWPVTAAALTFVALSDPRLAGRLATYPAVAIAGFAIFSRVVIGEWFVAGGFFVPENKSLGDLWMSMKEIGWGVSMLSSPALVWAGGAGVVALAAIASLDARRRFAVLPIALGATAAIPLAAFYRGHPFRIRYMVPLIAIEAIGCGVLAGVVRRFSLPAAVAMLALAAATLRPLDAKAPMVLEAQWDRPNGPVRARVTACLGQPRRGEKIMASMGSLGHYMQEASAAGFQLRDFLHEGNGDIWLAALERPRPFAEWILIEEKAEGGDMLAHIAREHPKFLDGYSRVCEGAGLALYKRGPSFRIGN